MLKERHFRVWKKLAYASNLAAGTQRANTSNPCVFRSRALSGSNGPSTKACFEPLQFHAPQTCTERMKFRSELLRPGVTCPHGARLLFTTASSNAVYTTTPGQKSSTKNKTNLDLKAKKSRKPAATERRRTNQRVRYF